MADLTNETNSELETAEEKAVPFYNLSLEKQLNVVKAYVVFYEKNKKAAEYKEIAPIAGVHPTQVSGCRKFWRSVKMLEPKDKGDVPTNVAIEYAKKIEWGQKEEAWKSLAYHLRDVWFVKHIVMIYRLHELLTEEELINILGSGADIPQRDAKTLASLKILIALLEKSFILLKDEKTEKFKLNPEFLKREPIEIQEEKDMVSFVIGKDRFAVSIDEFKSFVKEHGKKLSTKEYRIE